MLRTHIRNGAKKKKEKEMVLSETIKPPVFSSSERRPMISKHTDNLLRVLLKIPTFVAMLTK